MKTTDSVKTRILIEPLLKGAYSLESFLSFFLFFLIFQPSFRGLFTGKRFFFVLDWLKNKGNFTHFSKNLESLFGILNS